MHGRHRLGHRPLVHHVRPAGERRDAGDVRGHARHPAPGALLGDRAEVRRDDPLHGADGDPYVHEVGRRHPREVRPVRSLRVLGSVGEPINPEAWIWYRKHIGGDRTPDRGHLVADRDRRDDDLAAAGRHRDQAGLRAAAAARYRRDRRRRRGAARCPTAAAATSCSPSRGRRCCAPSGATTSGSSTRTGRASRASTSRATAPRRTTTATSGCSAGWTT